MQRRPPFSWFCNAELQTLLMGNRSRNPDEAGLESPAVAFFFLAKIRIDLNELTKKISNLWPSFSSSMRGYRANAAKIIATIARTMEVVVTEAEEGAGGVYLQWKTTEDADPPRL